MAYMRDTASNDDARTASQSQPGSPAVFPAAAAKYEFVPRDAAIAVAGALTFWSLILLMARMSAHAFPWPLAFILGFGLLPLALLGGLRPRA
jgi:hypothetical protein